MKDIVAAVQTWIAEGVKEIALATVISTWGSAPRQPGATMAVTADGRLTGSVSGGCVEGAVAEAALETLQYGRPQLLSFGVADETAWDVGLACGGTIEVFVECLDLVQFRQITKGFAADAPGYAAVLVEGPERLVGARITAFQGRNAFGTMDRDLVAEVGKLAAQAGESRAVTLAPGKRIFIDIFAPSPVLVVVGGVQIAQALCTLAQVVGYKTILIDPRGTFGSAERFPDVTRLIEAWPKAAFDEIVLTGNTAVAILTHDPKIDDPALEIAVASDAFYIGALGSRKTHAKRLARLGQSGIDAARLQRIRAPIGLDIGAQTPEEIAVAILAEIVAARHGRRGVAS